MNVNSEVLVAAMLLWMGVSGVPPWFAKGYGWSEWGWFVASLLTGPASWCGLYLKIRAEKERVGSHGPRLRLPSHIDWA